MDTPCQNLGFLVTLTMGNTPSTILVFGYLDDGKHPIYNLVFLDDI